MQLRSCLPLSSTPYRIIGLERCSRIHASSPAGNCLLFLPHRRSCFFKTCHFHLIVMSVGRLAGWAGCELEATNHRCGSLIELPGILANVQRISTILKSEKQRLLPTVFGLFIECAQLHRRAMRCAPVIAGIKSQLHGV